MGSSRVGYDCDIGNGVYRETILMHEYKTISSSKYSMSKCSHDLQLLGTLREQLPAQHIGL
jgi:hypothetical protein